MSSSHQKGTKVNTTEHHAEKPSRRTGIFAMLRAFLGLPGSCASERRRGASRPSIPPIAACAALAFALLLPTAASADSRIGVSDFPGNYGPGGISDARGVAVSAAEGGDIYLTDGYENERVDQFKPDGAFVRAFGWGIVPGAATGTGDLSLGSNVITNATTTSGSFSTGGARGAGKIVSGAGIPSGTVITKVTANTLELSNSASAAGTNVALTVAAGPGNVPVDEVQELTVTATSGQFKLTLASPSPGSSEATTTALPYNATHEEVQSALEALSNVGSGNVSVSGGPGDEQGTSPYLIEFKGRYADTNVRRLSATGEGLSGGNPSSEATLATPKQGSGALETCTTVCTGESLEEGQFGRATEPGQGTEPGQLRRSDEIAVDNDPASPSYGDLYVVDQRNFRIEKYDPEGHLLLIFGGEVDKTSGADVCTKADLEAGDTCGKGVPGTGPAHFYNEEPQTEAGGRKSWANEGANSITVGPDGTVYVGDFGRVQEFDPQGAFSGEFVLPVGGGEEPMFVAALALDAAGDLFARSVVYGYDPSTGEDGVLREVPGVREFGPGPLHPYIRTFDAEESTSEPTHIALDEEGNLFVSDYNNGPFSGSGCAFGTGDFTGCPEETFRAFKPDGTLYAVFTSNQVQLLRSKASGASLPRGIAIGDSGANLYATSLLGESRAGAHAAVIPTPQPGPPVVTEQHVTDVGHTTATLHGAVNPKQFDTEYRFQYIPAAQFKADGDEFGAGTEQTAKLDLGSVDRPDPVAALISGLTKGTVYRYRILAESECEPEANPGHVCVVEGERDESAKEIPRSFETLPAVSVRGLTTQIVAPEEVVLEADLNNNNSLAAGQYTICYGSEDGHYTAGCSEGTLAAGSGEFEPITATFTGLAPNTTYHYRLAADNESGHSETADRTFTTEETAAEENAAANCPNATLREENGSLALPDCRAYEQVSPVEKNGNPVTPFAILAPGGERVGVQSPGAFPGTVAIAQINEYLAQRTASGWLTRPVLAYPAGPEQPTAHFFGFDAELDRWLLTVHPRPTDPLAPLAETLYLGTAAGSFLQAGPAISDVEGHKLLSALEPIAQSADLSRLFFATRRRFLQSDPLPGDDQNGNANRIYQLAGVGGPDPTLSLLVELPSDLAGQGGQHCAFDESIGHFADWASTDGSTLFYTEPLDLVKGGACEGQSGTGVSAPNKAALFAWHEGSSVQLSAESPTQCHSPHSCAGAPLASALYDGASPDGRLAWFTTTQPLIDSDTDTTNDLYLARLTESGQLESLVQASAGEANPAHPTVGQGAGVQGVAKVSQQGNVAAFVAHGVLTAEPNEFGSGHGQLEPGESAASGADNLYLYDAASGKTRFVARLCSGPEESGSVNDPACPKSLEPSQNGSENGSDYGLWRNDQSLSRVQLTPDGHSLVFPSFGRLTPDDTDNVTDVYRYDFSTGRLIRVSFGRRGNDANGNDDAHPAVISEDTANQTINQAAVSSSDYNRAISADGSTVIFQTTAPLVSTDTNAGKEPKCENNSQTVPGCDVYEWEEDGHGTCREAGGCVSLLSSGLDPHGAMAPVIGGPSGRDVVFVTSRDLVPSDTDGVRDVYDARVEGGFPPPPVPPVCGSAEACHEKATEQSLHPNPTTEQNESGGNGPSKLECGKGRHRVKKHGEFRCVPNKKHHHKKKHHKHHHKRAHKRANANRRAAK